MSKIISKSCTLRLVVLVSRGVYGGGLEVRSVLQPRDLLDLGLLLYICKINMRSIVNSEIKIEQNIFENITETVTQLEMMSSTRVRQNRICSQFAVAQ